MANIPKLRSPKPGLIRVDSSPVSLAAKGQPAPTGPALINERTVRLAAGLLLLGVLTAIGAAIAQGSTRPLQLFAAYFLVDMSARLLTPKVAPSLALAGWLARPFAPVWVGLRQKEFAWMLGLGLAFTACLTVSWLQLPVAWALLVCTPCLILLFLEAAFGFCVGCHLQVRLTRETPQNCPGGSCPSR